MTLQEFPEMLLGVTDQVYHYGAPPEGEKRYIVWQETGRVDFYGSGKPEEKVWRVQVDLYTDREDEPMVENLERILEEHDDIAYSVPQVMYDTDVHLIRYLYECEVL